MAWTFDLPTALQIPALNEIHRPSNLKVAYDGKNLWYVNKSRTAVVVIDFWGPYDIWLDSVGGDVNGFFNRHLCPEDDIIRAGDRGPQIRILKTYTLPNLATIHSIGYLLNEVFVSASNGIVYRIPCDLSVSDEFNLSFLPEEKKISLVTDSNSDMRGLGTRMFFVAPAPVLSGGAIFLPAPGGGYQRELGGMPDLQEPDAQQLLWFDTATNSTGSAAIPGTKQLTPRRMASANDCLYVTAYNELCVYKLDSNGSALATIQINRDVENIYEVDGELWVISSNKGELTFGTGESGVDISAFMISKIAPNDTVTNIVGFPNFGEGGGDKNIHLAHSGAHIWLSGKDGKFGRIQLSNLRAILNDTDIVNGDDFNFKSLQTCYLSSIDAAEFQDIDINVKNNPAEPSTILNLWVSPAHTYQWYDGETFQTVSIPRYLVIFRDRGPSFSDTHLSSILVQRLPNAIKYESEFKINNYVAISSGARRYKGD